MWTTNQRLHHQNIPFSMTKQIHRDNISFYYIVHYEERSVIKIDQISRSNLQTILLSLSNLKILEG